MQPASRLHTPEGKQRNPEVLVLGKIWRTLSMLACSVAFLQSNALCWSKLVIWYVMKTPKQTCYCLLPWKISLMCVQCRSYSSAMLPPCLLIVKQLCFPSHHNKWHVNLAGTAGWKWALKGISKWHFNKNVCGDIMGPNESNVFIDMLTARRSPSCTPALYCSLLGWVKERTQGGLWKHSQVWQYKCT